MKGTADILEEDEYKPGYYVLTDNKSSGSFKIKKWLGLVSETHEETILDGDGKPVLLKSGKNMGQPKTKKHRTITIDPKKVDIYAEKLQINRYRIMYEVKGFPISRMQIQAIPRDGNTYVAKNYGITKSLYLIPIKRLPNKEVLDFYKLLADEVNEAFKTGYARECNNWEAWDGKRCSDFCEVKDACLEMSKAHGERRGIL